MQINTNNKIATEDDLYDVVLASSSYLYAFGEFSRRRNRQTWRRRFWVHDVLRRRDEYARLVQELRLDSARSHRYFRMSSSEQFDYVLELVGPHVFRLPTVRGCARTGSHDVVRRRTQGERRFKAFLKSVLQQEEQQQREEKEQDEWDQFLIQK